MPELLLFLRDRLIRMKCFESLERLRTTNNNDQNVTATVDVMEIKQPEQEMISVMTRLTRLESDNIKLFRKLDEIMMAINNQDHVRRPQ